MMIRLSDRPLCAAPALAAVIVAFTILAAPLVFACAASACGNDGADVEARAGQAITWATSLVQWHARRRVATAEPVDIGVLALQGEAESELAAAVDSFDAGMFETALTHARTVEALLNN